ncbi:hypothetical protein KSP39_PZI005221 [Platanthera zijinensis]|uniref:Uncharacterized protein n=1 Tax=Platanthera zijinensis TaxID=2320716 RepID=A0AAP0BVU1_9ASPA
MGANGANAAAGRLFIRRSVAFCSKRRRRNAEPNEALGFIWFGGGGWKQSVRTGGGRWLLQTELFGGVSQGGWVETEQTSPEVHLFFLLRRRLLKTELRNAQTNGALVFLDLGICTLIDQHPASPIRRKTKLTTSFTRVDDPSPAPKFILPTGLLLSFLTAMAPPL